MESKSLIRVILSLYSKLETVSKWNQFETVIVYYMELGLKITFAH